MISKMSTSTIPLISQQRRNISSAPKNLSITFVRKVSGHRVVVNSLVLFLTQSTAAHVEMKSQKPELFDDLPRVHIKIGKNGKYYLAELVDARNAWKLIREIHSFNPAGVYDVLKATYKEIFSSIFRNRDVALEREIEAWIADQNGSTKTKEAKPTITEKPNETTHTAAAGVAKKERKEMVLKAMLEKLVQKKDIPPFTHNKEFLPGVRPDFVWDLEDRIAMLECDEDQHKGYSKDGEVLREIRLLEKCNGKPLILIRYNPDEFKMQSSVVVLNGTIREDILRDLIKEITNVAESPTPTSAMTHYKLFYNCGCKKEDCNNYTHKKEYKSSRDLFTKNIQIQSLIEAMNDLSIDKSLVNDDSL